MPARDRNVEPSGRIISYPGILTVAIYPGIKDANIDQYGNDFNATDFHRLPGPSPPGVRASRRGRAGRQAGSTPPPDEPIIIFEDGTGRSIDFDLRGGDREVLARVAKLVPPPVEETAPPTEPRGRGRPKLGVVAREVTLLPRHWEWLGAQPGGASVALAKTRRRGATRKRRQGPRAAGARCGLSLHVDHGRQSAEFEEASRALFADDRRRFTGLIADWPADVRDHIVKLAYSDRALGAALSLHPIDGQAARHRAATASHALMKGLSMSAPKPLWKTFLLFLAPLMLSNALQSLFGTVSNVYLGQMIGVDALAAVSAFFPVMFFLSRLRHGPEHRRHRADRPGLWRGRARQDQDRRRHDAARSACCSRFRLLCSAACSAGNLMTMLATPPDILDQASAYARIMLLTMPLGFVFLLMTAMIRGVGDAVTPLLALALSTTIGLILTPILIRGAFGLPAAGITSPAWAAAICQRADAARAGRLSAADEACTGTGCRAAASSCGSIVPCSEDPRHRTAERGRHGGDGDRRAGAARPRQRLWIGCHRRLWRGRPGDGLHAVHGTVDFDRGLDLRRTGHRRRRQAAARCASCAPASCSTWS